MLDPPPPPLVLAFPSCARHALPPAAATLREGRTAAGAAPATRSPRRRCGVLYRAARSSSIRRGLPLRSGAAPEPAAGARWRCRARRGRGPTRPPAVAAARDLAPSARAGGRRRLVGWWCGAHEARKASRCGPDEVLDREPVCPELLSLAALAASNTWRRWRGGAHDVPPISSVGPQRCGSPIAERCARPATRGGARGPPSTPLRVAGCRRAAASPTRRVLERLRAAGRWGEGGAPRRQPLPPPSTRRGRPDRSPRESALGQGREVVSPHRPGRRRP